MDSINKYFLDHIKYFWNNLGKKAFKGRITRKQYWMYFLFSYLFGFLVGIVDVIIDIVIFDDYESEDLSLIANLALIPVQIPYFGLLWRRAHDMGFAGWVGLIPLINLYVVFHPSVGPNEHDENTSNDNSNNKREVPKSQTSRPNNISNNPRVKYPEGKKNY